MSQLLRAWHELGRDSLHYLLGEGFAKGLVYLLFVVLARYFATAEFGSLNLFVALLGPLALVVALGLPDALGRFYFRELPFGPVVASSLVLVAASSAALALVVAALRGVLGRLLELPPWLLLLAALSAPAVALRTAWMATLRAQGRSLTFLAARLAEPLVSLALVLGLVAWLGRFDLGLVLLAYVGGIAVVAALGVTRLLRLARAPSLALSRELLVFSLPLVLHALAMTALASFDQIILNQLLGLETTGIYAFAYRVGMAMFLVSFGITAAWNPYVLRRLEDASRRDEPGTLLRAVCAAQVGIGFALMILLPPVARLVGAAAYADSVALIPIVVCGYVWMALYSLATPFLVFHHRTAALARFSATALLVNVVLNYLLIPQFGPLAAAVTTVASYALLFALAWRQVLRDHPGLPLTALALTGLLTVPAAIGLWWVLS